MNNVFIVVLFLFGIIHVQAQYEEKFTGDLASILSDAFNTESPKNTIETDTTRHWIRKGNAILLFNQSSFNNWVAGGEDNVAGNVALNYDINYKKGDWTWQNKIIAAYGIVKTQTVNFSKKTDDRIELNSIVGKKASGYWYYSTLMNFRTQFNTGYIYTTENNIQIRTPHTNFMSPGYLYFGPGMLWRKNENLNVNLSPLTSRMTFVNSAFTVPDAKYFGVEEGKNMLYEIGFNASMYYKFILVDHVSLENILNLYSNYLRTPQNININYQLNVVMTINSYLSTNIAFQAIYDDLAFKGFQLREVLGVGINYVF